MKEIWKDIETLLDYQISNYGRIRSKDRYKNHSNQFGKCGKRLVKGKILKTSLTNTGYYQIILRSNGKTKGYLIHRLVAKAFIPNPNNLPQINHIDGNRENNRVDNLEWSNQSHNVKEAYRLGLQKVKIPATMEGYVAWNKGKKMSYEYRMNGCNSKKVIQYDLDGNIIKQWNNIHEAETSLHIVHISSVCRGHRKTAGGYIWRYANK